MDTVAKIQSLQENDRRNDLQSETARQNMDEMASTKCHNDRMTKKRTRRANYKTTEWNLGQPLAFPPRLNPSTFERLAREAVEEAVNDPFKRKRVKRTRKK